MGKQINFYMSPEDEERFKDYILRTGEILFEGKNNVPKLISELPDVSELWWFNLHLCLTHENLIYRDISLEKKYIDSSESNVIEWMRTTQNSQRKDIDCGRLWVEMYTYKDGEKNI